MSKLDQLRALREAKVRGGYTGPPGPKPQAPSTGSGVPKPTSTVPIELAGYVRVVCPVCEARRLKNLAAVRKHRAKKISKKVGTT